jgi:hypothetical protein
VRRAVLVLVGLLALAGCGANSNGTGAAGGVAEDYLHDLANHNWAAACQLLTDQLREQLGDCPAALAKRHSDLPVSDLDELRDATVDHVTYNGSSTTAKVYTQDVKVRTSVTVKVNGTPKTRTSTSRSIAAYHATNGQGLELTKTPAGWRISGGGV